ncbi:ATP-binding protein [Pseudomonas sp. S 311-6]|uniref:sensor histidine kinase n=1 Tax=Kerstersia gyiorum TaxID=206506 RepID=UPI0020984DDC|nr:ATP-binding protein [Pseudomonas sp. S 311-6]
MKDKLSITRETRLRPGVRRALWTALLLLAMALVFVADTVTDYAIAFPVFYCAVILAAMRIHGSRTVVALSSACVVLTVLSFLLTRSGAYEIGLINSALSIVAIGVTTWLALKMASAQRLAHAAQARLERMARSSSMGELTTSIAHEVNQPLAAISTSAHACQRWLDMAPPNLEKARQAAGRIVEDAHRASAVIERVRALTRGEAPAREPFDLNAAVIEAALLMHAEFERHGVELILKLADEMPAVLADQVQVQQVLGNLLLNAAEVMDQAGIRAGAVTLSTGLAPGGQAEVAVADQGPGLAPAELAQIFDAFWSTKENGLGLGLAISRSIVEANGGRIEALARPGGGLVCRFTLALAPQENV